jgi:uncharacterized Fe-S center protein
MSKVYLIKDAKSMQYEQLLEKELRQRLKSGMTVAVKLHMGEDKGMFSPELARRAVSVLLKLGCKPFLFDTPVNYPGARNTPEGYLKLAEAHGFSREKTGCPVRVSNDYVNVKTKSMDVEVSKDLANADALLVLTHVKGHPCTGVGGAIKNLGMGCVSPKSKGDQHGFVKPIVNDDCTACGLCKEVCPFSAIEIEEKAAVDSECCGGCTNCVYNCPNNAMTSEFTFDTLLAEAASAALQVMKGKPVYYINDARSITRNCDCFGNPGERIANDVGVILGDDIIAVEMAATDAIINQEGRNVFLDVHHHDPYLHIKEAEALGMGSEEYELEKI